MRKTNYLLMALVAFTAWSAQAQETAMQETRATNTEYGVCPAGFLFNGELVDHKPIYPKNQQITIYYTLNKVIAKKKELPTTYFDNYCIKTESQTLPCPAGFKGEIKQSRTVKANDADKLIYGEWNTTANTCSK